MAKTNLWVNRLNEKSVHEQETAEGRKFYNVSAPCLQSATGFMSFAVNTKQVIRATDKAGQPVDGMVNILVGSETGSHTVSICTALKTDTTAAVYENIKMTNKEIVDAVKAARKAYRAAKATETAED